MRFNTVTSALKREYITPLSAKEASLKNCLIKDGSIKSRAGLFSKAEKQIFKRESNSALEMSFILTDCYIHLDGKYGRVAVSVADNLMGSIIYNMRLVYSDGEVKNLGAIEFTKVTPDLFGYPDTFTVFRGAPTAGCGIYFIARQVYGGDYPDFVRVMELSEAMNGWSMIDSSQIYAPTLLANGRGENYHNAAPLGEALKLPDPIKPESVNLLGAGFYACYTADSASSGFKLPFADIDNSLVRCEFSCSGQTYVWNIYAEEDVSSAVTVDGEAVKMYCDRTAGRIYFLTDGGAAWSPPYTGILNNLRVKAYKTVEGNSVKVAAMSGCCRLDGDAMTQGSNVTVFYGSRLYPAEVILNSPRHPLYFPEEGQHMLGEASKEITRLLIKDRYLLAFKENEMFSAEIKQYDGDTEAVVFDVGATESNGVYPLVFKKGATLNSAPLPRSIALLDGDIIYASAGGGIYRLTGSGTYKTERLGDSQISVNDKSFALIYGGAYLLIRDNSAQAVQRIGSGFVFGQWSFPEKMTGGFSYLDGAVLFAEFNQNGEYLIYPTVFKGAVDRTVTTDGTAFSVVTHPIEAGYSLPLFSVGCNRRRIFRIRADGKGRDIDLALYDREKPLLARRGLFKGGSAYFLCGCQATQPEVQLSFSGDTLIEGLAVEYKSLNII